IEMIDGAKSHASRLGIDLHPLETVTSDHPSYEIEAAIQHTLTQSPKTDGIICASTNAAMAVVSGLEASGRVIGQDVDVIAKEAMPFLKRFRKEILTMHEDVANAGEFLCRAVMQAVDHPDRPPMQCLEQPAV
ncbi:MAG: substrate-binding domain-containing protein, partial [Pseudomonadota bacterium]